MSVNTELYTNEGAVIRVRTSKKKKKSFHFISPTVYKVIENEEEIIADKAKG